MTTETETIVVAAYSDLHAVDPIMAMLGSDPEWGPWLFSWNMHADIEGTSSCAIVLSHEGSWSSSNTHNTLAFPRVRVQCWADDTRDAAKNVTAQDARDKSWAVWLAVRAHWHRPYGFSEQWSDHVRVIGSYCLDEPVWPLDSQGGDGPGYWEGYFAMNAIYG